MTTTRRQHGIAGLAHVIEHVFGMDPNTSNIAKALTSAKIESIFDLLALNKQEVDELKFIPGGSETTPKQLLKGDRGLISCLQDLVIWKGFKKETIAPDYWSTMTGDEFDEFRQDPEVINWRIHGNTPVWAASSPRATTPGNATTSTTSTPKYTPVDLFCHGIKCDPISFPTLKDERYNDNWYLKDLQHSNQGSRRCQCA